MATPHYAKNSSNIAVNTKSEKNVWNFYLFLSTPTGFFFPAWWWQGERSRTICQRDTSYFFYAQSGKKVWSPLSLSLPLPNQRWYAKGKLGWNTYALPSRFCTFGADLHAQSALSNKISASELSRTFMKSALLVGLAENANIEARFLPPCVTEPPSSPLAKFDFALCCFDQSRSKILPNWCPPPLPSSPLPTLLGCCFFSLTHPTLSLSKKLSESANSLWMPTYLPDYAL